MKEWIVSAPMSGMASCVVEAETEEEARRKAFHEGEWDADEWEVHLEGCRGNICQMRSGVDVSEN